jgi:hypothetical protein
VHGHAERELRRVEARVKTWPGHGAPGHRGAAVAAREKREQNVGVQQLWDVST